MQRHDGQPFSAADVAYSFDKMLDPKRSVIAGRFPGCRKAAGGQARVRTTFGKSDRVGS
ncbi:MAG: hypothetical protein O7G88_14465 [bacterium]|nr:hypothetical protein [bacterium]